MIVLGVSRQVHDPAAALLVDGRCVAAAEEERFTRVKHAPKSLPLNAAQFCLEIAGIDPQRVDAVAWSWSRADWKRRRWAEAWRQRGRPRRAWSILTRDKSNRDKRQMREGLAGLGLPMDRLPIQDVAHHLAHAASAYYFSGFDRSAILTLDGMGEYDTTWCATGEGNRITPTKIWTKPHSLGFFYGTATDFLGFKPNNGEFKTMGMAAYGDASQIDLRGIIDWGDGEYVVNGAHCAVSRADSHEGHWYSPHWVERFGPPREGKGLAEPYTHIAAATQHAFEQCALELVRGPLQASLEAADGRLSLAGGCALNVVLNQRLRELPEVSEIFVQPSSHDAGGALGAAAEVAARGGDRIVPWDDGDAVRLGPDVTDPGARAAVAALGLPFEEPADLTATVADLLAQGEVVAWVQGRMEWGPRALGCRSLLAHPSREGARAALDGTIKAREPWRPYCPAVLAERAPEILERYAHSPFLTQNFTIQPAWRERLRHAIHIDGSARAQTVTAKADPRFHALLVAFEARTGIPALLNTSLNRHDEPIVATAEEALDLFLHTGLQHLALGPLLLSKRR